MCLEIVGEMHLKNYFNFLGDYSRQLRDMADALGCEKNPLWDPRLCPVTLQVN